MCVACSPQSRSSELSPQSLSWSHTHFPGMHCPSSHLYSLSVQGLGSANQNQGRIRDRGRHIYRCITPQLQLSLLSELRYTELHAHRSSSHLSRRHSCRCHRTASGLGRSGGCHIGNHPEDHRSPPLLIDKVGNRQI